MKKKLIVILCFIIVALCCTIFGLKNENKPKEIESVSYNTNEKIEQIKILYRGRGWWTEDEIVVDLVKGEVKYTNETRVYVNVEGKPNFYYTYELSDSDNIEKFLKEKILYGNWSGESFDVPEYISIRPAGKEWGVMLWEMKIVSQKGEYNFFNDDQFPIFWYDLIRLIADEAGTRPESFGIKIEE